MKTLILGLGNDLLSDDAVGIIASRLLATELADRTDIDVVDSPLHGIALLEIFLGYDRAIVIDAIKTGDHPPGTIIEIDPKGLSTTPSPSPHYTGLPELMSIASELNLKFPEEIIIVALEVVDPHTIGGEMSKLVTDAIPELIEQVKKHI